MADVSRIGVEEARRKVVAGSALLVCAYDDEKCKKVSLDGSINMTQLASRAATLPKDQEIIFYCA